ncbi:MAG: apolipoprotein N-acyltransferase [Bdellovibrionales bacterium]|nr:apolipoprotein N-acyltransferase [Bdellovibrionales bacterium]
MQNQNSWKKVFFSGWICQFVLTLIGFNWVAYTLQEFGHIPWPAAVIGLILFCSFASLHIPLGGLLWYFLSKKLNLQHLQKILLLPLCISFFELTYPMIFDWHFGYTWYWADWPGVQTSEIWGIKFLSVFSIFLNLLFYFAWSARHQKKQALLYLGSAMIFFASINLGGFYLKKQLPPPNASVNALIVQANIGNLEKQYAEKGAGFTDFIVKEYFSLTESGLKEFANEPVDFAVWPETAFPVRMNPRYLSSGYGYQLVDFLKKNHIGLFTGAYGEDPRSQQVSNSLFAFNNEGMILTPTYTKTVLLAFGEYIPGGDWIPKLYDWIPEVAQFARGHGPVIQSFGNIHMGPQICYEGLFDWFARQSSILGSEILINVTNDSWYGKWQERYQHLYMTLSRALEVRRPIIRSTNTGISSVALADGTILQTSPLHEKWKYLYKIPYFKNPTLTLFSKWGYWIPYLFLIFWGVCIFGIKQFTKS